MDNDDFDRADRQAGVMVRESPVAAELSMVPHPSGAVPANVVALRDQLVRQYHAGAPSLIKRLRDAGKRDIESLLVALIDEVVKETDNLLGNGLIALENGNLRDSTIISFKRTEALEKAIKAVQAKQEFERTGGLDIDSPAMVTVFKFFMMKAKQAFEHMGVDAEMNDLFFRTFSDVTEEWKKELREEFEVMKV